MTWVSEVVGLTWWYCLPCCLRLRPHLRVDRGGVPRCFPRVVPSMRSVPEVLLHLAWGGFSRWVKAFWGTNLGRCHETEMPGDGGY
jgi:hypothetical protein